MTSTIRLCPVSFSLSLSTVERTSPVRTPRSGSSSGSEYQGMKRLPVEELPREEIVRELSLDDDSRDRVRAREECRRLVASVACWPRPSLPPYRDAIGVGQGTTRAGYANDGAPQDWMESCVLPRYRTFGQATVASSQPVSLRRNNRVLPSIWSRASCIPRLRSELGGRGSAWDPLSHHGPGRYEEENVRIGDNDIRFCSLST